MLRLQSELDQQKLAFEKGEMVRSELRDRKSKFDAHNYVESLMDSDGTPRVSKKAHRARL